MKKLLIPFTISFGLFFSLSALAQGPTAPEAASFEPIDAADVVNLVTGDFSYVLPLIHVPGPGGGYPLALSYHSGIAMGQESSWLGLGWNVNPGAINRSVTGTPDDWLKTKTYTSLYNKGGISRTYSGGVTVGWSHNISTAINASYTENKSFGGENSYDFNIGVSAVGPGINVGLNSNGFNLGSRGISVGQSFRNGGTTFKFGSSIGVSINTRGGGGVSSPIGYFSFGGSSAPTPISESSWDLDVKIPIGPVSVNLGFSKTRYWLSETDYMNTTGSLYAGRFQEALNESALDEKVSFDSYEDLSGLNRKNQLNETNFGFMGYDRYSVSGQGVSGSIEPKLFEEGVLRNNREHINDLSIAYFSYPASIGSGAFGNSLDNGKIHFYFTQDNASFLNVESDDWNVPVGSSTYNDIFSFDTTNGSVNGNTTNNGQTVNGFDSQNNRLKKGAFIETFTNGELRSALNQSNSIAFFEAKGVDRNLPVYNENGIGAYRITTGDGRVYHYSLPVYQKEQFSRVTARGESPSLEFNEQSQLDPYATHWLLTAITGPDYIDVNGNFGFDEGDYGYWVAFEYGKWSDGFAWRTPITDYEKTSATINHQWGFKEVYYLDKIKTKTHTALFVKDVRDDNRGAELSIGNSLNDPKVYKDNLQRSVVLGDDGNYYIKGLYSDISIGSSAADASYTFGHSESKMYLKTYPHRSLKLSKIILVRNENVAKVNSSQPSSILSGELKIDQKIELFYAASFLRDEISHIHDENWSGEYFGNVLDSQDIVENAPNIESSALRVINFDQDYELMPQSSNSNAPGGGRLTLRKLSFAGKGEVSVVPPYNFQYFNGSDPYRQGLKDDWGYAWNTSSWNLSRIITPLGEKLQINYEQDSFHQEAAITQLVFDGPQFDMKFTEASNGLKYVTFRNHIDNSPEENIFFSDFFSVGEQHNVDVQYYWDPNHTGGDRIADVAAICPVSQVGSSYVTFQIPTINTNTHVRNGTTCNEESWVYYENFFSSNLTDDVVGRTSNYIDHHNTDECGTMSNGESRAKITFFSNRKILDKQGGGIRVKNIQLLDNQGNTYETAYGYNNPNTNVSSGITSYEPSLRTKNVRYVTQMPGPSVMYEYVTVSKLDAEDVPSAYMKDVYNFKVLEPMVLTNDGFTMGDILSLERTQHAQYQNQTVANSNVDLEFSKFNLINNTSTVGRLISKVSYNRYDQEIASTFNDYYTNDEIHQGIIKESFKSYKELTFQGNSTFLLSSSSKTDYPNMLKETLTRQANTVNTSRVERHDFLTGLPLETIRIDSDGVFFKDIVVPAYTIPEYNTTTYGMGSKVDNGSNKNMLTQQAANYSYFLDPSGNEKLIAVGINTWNNLWSYRDLTGNVDIPSNSVEKIWRKHKDYVWKGQLSADGSYANYTGDFDNFNWEVNALESSQPDQWLKINETTSYNHFSAPIEIVDINKNYASTKFDHNNENVLSTANAAYTEQYYSGAEAGVNSWAGGEVRIWNFSADFAHTGIYSEKSGSAAQSFRCAIVPVLENGDNQKDFKVSVWAKKDNYTNARLYNGDALVEFTSEKVFAGDWVQLNAYIENVSTTKNIYITSSSGTIYFDDFRVHPLQSSMSSYVYNEWNELSDILGTNNMATHYEYDSNGRLLKTYAEVADTGAFDGGVKLAAEYEMNYGRISQEEEDETYLPLAIVSLDSFVYFIPNTTSSSTPQGNVRFQATAQGVSGGSGNYSYVWDFRVQGGNYVSLTTTSSSSLDVYSDAYNSIICGQQVALRCTVVDLSQAGIQESITSDYELLNCML